MAIQVKTPLIETHILEKCDKLYGNTGSPTKIQIRQASQGEEELRSSLLALTDRRMDNEGVLFRTKVSLDDLHREEVFLTLADCDILDSALDDDGQPKRLFTFEKNRISNKAEFLKAWARLDPPMADEIIEKVHETNKHWGPGGNAG